MAILISNLRLFTRACSDDMHNRLNLQVTDRAAAALGLKADGEDVTDLRLYVKGQFADVRAAAKQGIGQGRLTHTTGAGQTLCLSCDQPLAPIKGHMHEALAPQGWLPDFKSSLNCQVVPYCLSWVCACARIKALRSQAVLGFIHTAVLNCKLDCTDIQADQTMSRGSCCDYLAV